jgi:hypothetical protein
MKPEDKNMYDNDNGAFHFLEHPCDSFWNFGFEITLMISTRN